MEREGLPGIYWTLRLAYESGRDGVWGCPDVRMQASCLPPYIVDMLGWCHVADTSGSRALPQRCRGMQGPIWAQSKVGSLAMRVTRVENTRVNQCPPECILPGEPRVLTFGGELVVETGRLEAPSAPEPEPESDSEKSMRESESW